MNPPIVRSSRDTLQLHKSLGKGGEGTVYEIANQPERVVKIYHRAMPREKVDKIRSMASICTDQLLSFTAWPLELVWDRNNRPCGFIMPKITLHKDIHTLYSPKSRKAEFPIADYAFLIRTAANTARAFAAVHDSGCVIGDVNHSLVAVSSTATVKLVDCDSFQVISGGRKFLCHVGVSTFTPPELQGRAFGGIERTKNHDCFGLAVLLFLLLFMGRHPFAGRFSGHGDMGIDRAIAEFRFAYGAGHVAAQMRPPPDMPPLSILSPQIEHLFEKSFSKEGCQYGGRPQAIEWVHALRILEQQLMRCPNHEAHFYYRSLSTCPWCGLEKMTGVVLFLATVAAKPGGGAFDLELTWARILAIKSPGLVKELPTTYNARPSSRARAARRSRQWKKYLGGAAIAIAFLAAMGAAPNAFFLWLVGAMICWAVVANWAGPNSDTDEFSRALTMAQEDCQRLQSIWDEIASDDRFQRKLRDLERQKDEWHALGQLRQRRYQQLLEGRRLAQLRHFLERFEIERSVIPGIGPARKAMLQSYNIETAWDVKKNRILNVPGFGRTLAGELMKWRKELEDRFRFDAARGVDPRDAAQLDQEIAEKKRNLEITLLKGETALKQVHDTILSERAKLAPKVEAALRAVAQARADHEAIS